MGYTESILLDVRKQSNAHPEVLAETRVRTRLVRGNGLSVTLGSLRHYGSGSLEHHTQNHPIDDGDAGLVLNRVFYPRLGPDGSDEPPDDVVADICGLLGPKIRETYPKARCGRSKRGPKVWFGEALDGQDPTVDLVIALTRRTGSGLWIPNLEKGTWEASDPEGHSLLLNGDSATLRSTRRKVIRLLKAWNKQFADPVLSSFHLSVLALEFVTAGASVSKALLTVLEKTSERMAKRGATKDPAGVSANIKLLGSWDSAERRARLAANNLRTALEHDTDPTDTASRAALARIFHQYLEPPDTLSWLIEKLRPRTPVSTSTLGLGSTGFIAPTRAYGNLRIPGHE